MEIQPTQIAVGELIGQSVLMIKEKTMKHRISLSIETGNAPSSITADERMLKQVLYNLLANAVKFTPDGGKLKLRACEVDDPATLPMHKIGDGWPRGNGHRFIEFAVSDTGIGVRPEDQERIFNRFEQADGSLTRKYTGTGLGLFLSKRMVELHKGKIWVESEGEGKGSMFRFILPHS